MGCADLSIELRVTIYISNQTKQENALNRSWASDDIAKPINISNTQSIPAQGPVV
jgi:hypothetical protein